MLHSRLYATCMKEDVNMKITGILPIGTVVLLNKATHRVMITGYAQRSMSNPDRVYDYAACAYPEGILSADQNILFNQDQIETLVALGHVDGEAQAIMAQVEDLLEKVRASEQQAAEAEAEEEMDDEGPSLDDL